MFIIEILMIKILNYIKYSNFIIILMNYYILLCIIYNVVLIYMIY